MRIGCAILSREPRLDGIGLDHTSRTPLASCPLSLD